MDSKIGDLSEEIEIDKPYWAIQFIEVMMRVKTTGRIMDWVEIKDDEKTKLINAISRDMKQELKELIERKVKS